MAKAIFISRLVASSTDESCGGQSYRPYKFEKNRFFGFTRYSEVRLKRPNYESDDVNNGYGS